MLRDRLYSTAPLAYDHDELFAAAPISSQGEATPFLTMLLLMRTSIALLYLSQEGNSHNLSLLRVDGKGSRVGLNQLDKLSVFFATFALLALNLAQASPLV